MSTAEQMKALRIELRSLPWHGQYNLARGRMLQKLRMCECAQHDLRPPEGVTRPCLVIMGACWMSHCQGSPSLVTLVPVCGIPVSQRLGSRMQHDTCGTKRRPESSRVEHMSDTTVGRPSGTLDLDDQRLRYDAYHPCLSHLPMRHWCRAWSMLLVDVVVGRVAGGFWLGLALASRYRRATADARPEFDQTCRK